MKKVLLMGVLASFVFGSTWTCYRYVNGEPTGGYVKVVAYSKNDALLKSLKKYKKLGYRVDYTKCR